MANWLIPALQQAGFKGDALRTMWAIIQRESGGNPKAFNPRKETQDLSYGLAQINMLGKMGADRRAQWGLTSNEQLYDPATNLKAAYRLSRGGKDFGAWGLGPNAYRSGAGFDTIRKYYNQFPGAQSGGAAPVPRSQPTGTATTSGLTLKQVNKLARQFGFSSISQAFGIPPKQVRELFSSAVVVQSPVDPKSVAFKATPPGKAAGTGVAELFYDPAGSKQQWDQGNWINPIGGHSDHVHVSFSNPQAALRLIQIARDMGLRVGENPYIDPVDGNHVAGSFHGKLFPGLYDGKQLGEAIDVSGPASLMMSFYRVARRYIS
jgi:hypothetical protein